MDKPEIELTKEQKDFLEAIEAIIKKNILPKVIKIGFVLLVAGVAAIIFILVSKPEDKIILNPQRADVTPSQLANEVVAILAEIEPDTSFLFSSAELTLSAKQTISSTASVGAEIEKPFTVKVKGEVAATSETSVEVSYTLEDRVLATIELKTLPPASELDFTVPPGLDLTGKGKPTKNPTPWGNTQQKSGKPNVYKSLRHAFGLKQRVSKVNYANDKDSTQAKKIINDARNEVAIEQKRIQSRYLPSSDVKDAFVAAIKQAIEENKVIREKFGKTCVSVEISFSIEAKGEGGAEFEFVGVGVSGSTSIAEEGTHTLKLSFGGC